MKRPLSPNLAVDHSTKKQQADIQKNSGVASPLIAILRQYGLFEAIVTNLCPDDLLALALVSKASHQAIFPRPGSLENVLGRLTCSGRGVEIRNECHVKSKFFSEWNCTEYVQCGSGENRRNIESRPCVRCKVNTCNECRTHCVYQSIYETPSDPDDPDELPNFSGFVLLDPLEQAILSPHHLYSEDAVECPHWENPAVTDKGPYHDQGYLDVALQSAASGAPECIDTILDLDLGQHSFASLSEDSRYWGSPSPVVLSLSHVAEQRKIFLCELCFKNAPKGPTALKPPRRPLDWLPLPEPTEPISPCRCTIRKRFLDRWLCLRCYTQEDAAISECVGLVPKKSTGQCRCGLNSRHTLCLWCWGEVLDIDDFGPGYMRNLENDFDLDGEYSEDFDSDGFYLDGVDPDQFYEDGEDVEDNGRSELTDTSAIDTTDSRSSS